MIPYSDDMHSDTVYDTIDSYMYYEGDGIYTFSDQDMWGWGGSLTPVPGFGFFPKRVNDELDHMTQVSHAYSFFENEENYIFNHDKKFITNVLIGH